MPNPFFQLPMLKKSTFSVFLLAMVEWFAFTEKRFSKRISRKQNGDCIIRQRLMKKDGVLLFFMKTERQRGFCRFLPCAIVKRRLGAIRKVPWRKGICRQKESRLFVGSDSIGSGNVTHIKRVSFHALSCIRRREKGSAKNR